MTDTIAAVVVTYNRKHLVIHCLEALINQTRQLDRIFIIDNASTDGTQELLKELNYLNNPRIEYVFSNINTGGAGGFYQGMKLAYERNYDLIWIMDDDVQPDENCLMELWKTSQTNLDTLIIAPLKLYSEGYWGGATLKRNLTNPFIIHDEYVYFNNADDIEKCSFRVIEVDDVPFEGPLIRKEAMQKVGYPLKEFFFQGDDAEYSLRVGRLGKVTLCLDAKLRRLLPLAKHTPAAKMYYWCRNYSLIDMLYGKSLAVRFFRPVLRVISLLRKGVINWDWQFVKEAVRAYADLWRLNQTYQKEIIYPHN